VDDLTFDESGVLWATTGENRTPKSGVNSETPRLLYRLIGDEWQLVEQPTKVFAEPIHWEVVAAPGGGVYLGSGHDGPPSPTSGVYFTDGTTWELFPQDFTCGSLAVDTAGTLWATCPDFLTRLVDGRWVDVAEGSTAQSVATGPDGSVWFTTFSAPAYELWRSDGNGWSSVAPCADCQGPRSIVGVDSEGAAWVARGGCGLEGLTRFDPATGDGENVDVSGVRDVAFAPDGSVWMALPCDGAPSSAGVVRYMNGDIRLFTTADGLPTNIVQAVEIGPDGSVYVGTEYGVSRYVVDAETWTAVGNLS
jgi:sugar lactone lactonase YvrE